MISREIIDRFLKGEYSLEELALLKKHFTTDDIQTLEEIIREDWNKADVQHVPQEELHKQWKQFKAQLPPAKAKKPTRKLTRKLTTYSALIAASLVLGFFIFKPKPSDLNSQVKEKIYLSNGSNVVTVKLGDGSVQNILPTATRTIVSKNGVAVAQQEQNKLVYALTSASISEQQYNTLTVPLGKTFKVVLSDQSEITLNAGSSLRYPIQFLPNKTREVYLSGEGYFSIQKSKTSFVVHTTNISTTVYGTQFNISSYPSESTTKVVLVEGSIGVHQLNNIKSTRRLVPNEMAAYDKTNKKIMVSTVDVSSYISWIDGVLLFKNENFLEIIKKLERHFDRKINVETTNFSKAKFTGRFEIESLDEILKTIQKIVKFDYTSTADEIKINP